MNSFYLWITADENISVRPPRRRMEQAFKIAVRKFKKRMKGKRPSIEIHFVGHTTMKRMNFKFRGRNKATDILSFESFSAGLLGSLVIDIDTARIQAKEYKHSLEQEILELFIHGVLHLLGFDHEKDNEAKMMARHERFIIQRV